MVGHQCLGLVFKALPDDLDDAAVLRSDAVEAHPVAQAQHDVGQDLVAGQRQELGMERPVGSEVAGDVP
eukprot:gene27498-35499_t